MPRSRVYFFTVERAQLEALTRRQPTALLDMLRYDQAQVSMYDETFVVLKVTDRLPTNSRWASFGLPVIETALAQPTDNVPARLMQESRATLERMKAPKPTPDLSPLRPTAR